MNPPRKDLIYLTGFMGSGKSTLAPVLARTLGYEFIDVDEEIESKAGRTVSEIFRSLGEAYFREIELEIVGSLSLRRGCVISLGGGTISIPENLRVVKSSGILIHLKASPEQIFQRVRTKKDRPLLESPDGARLSDEELRSRIRTLLLSREPFYNQADVTVSLDDKTVSAAVGEIVNRIKNLPE